MAGQIRIGTAGWAIPRAVAGAFPAEGAALTRYAARFGVVEINSTFYRSHRPSTYARWVQITPPEFRFALKLPRAITHEARLVGVEHELAAFRAEAEQLGDKLGPLLVQLPPSLAFEAAPHGAFLGTLRDAWPGPIVCEPRHPSWFEGDADAALAACQIARAAADPAAHPSAAHPGGWPGLSYVRLHGSPRMYWSAYDAAALQALAEKLKASDAPETWCVFDNTASGAAAANALEIQALLQG